jgi:uncharacterized protein YndB with AHSA1/START domain
MDTQPIIVERTFNVPASKIWKAITDKDEMKKWYFDLADFRAEKGFQFQFSGGPSPERQYVHLCEVKEISPDKKLSYTWRYKGFPGDSLVTFELMGQGNQTVLRLTHSGLDSFPKDNSDFDKSNFIQGWNEIINTSLREYLVGKS